MTQLTKQVRVDEGNHAALDQLKRVLGTELQADLAHNDVVTLGLCALAVQRPELARYIPGIEPCQATAVAA